MSDCQAVVPNLIGKSRAVRTTKRKLIVPKGYKTSSLIGKSQANGWREQLKLNKSMMKVLEDSKLNEEVDMMLAQQKIQAKKEAAKQQKLNDVDDEGIVRDHSAVDGEKGGEHDINKKNIEVSHHEKLTTSDATDSKRRTSDIQVEVLDTTHEDIPSVIKPLPKLDKSMANPTQALKVLIEDMQKEDELNFENFEKNESIQKYARDDYKVKAFLMLITQGKKQKIWMPGKTRFDKRGGKFSERVAGLGQIPGLN